MPSVQGQCRNLRTDPAPLPKVLAAGVVVKQGKRKLVWLTPVADFFGPYSFTNPDNILQRCLPLNRFALIPAMNRENVEAAMRLR